jgi:Na+-translocating ferredoxin:NAD+ oxidoreductase RnfD subunit
MRKVLRFFKTPKGLLIIILSILTCIAAPGEGVSSVIAGMGSAILIAGIVDLLILRLRKKVWEFPSGAVLTAMIVSMVIRAQEHWYVLAVTSVVAVLSKYLIRTRSANVFNPAAIAIVSMFYVFHMGQSWWGALPEVTPLWLQGALLITGIYITDRVNKMPLVLAFLATYLVLFTATAYLGDTQRVAEIFRSPDIQGAIYFSLIILTDPPTSPAKYPDQLICGIVVAVVSYAVFEKLGVVYFLLAGVLVGNIWEAWRRVHRRSTSRFPEKLVVFLREIRPVSSDFKNP